ncbi:Chanoclavine-I aldehyde reductase [Lachnellula subtilissima]|uniref:Chanoclavine-I aldehyde reductase n=1 Tax=Lachnellula subtilissima TaxID=602034 RepID=A0A8H8UFG0_9HELO|nr:Chanoclavine-I aldehyde reductase [Lachnellula subtilissima]
MAESRLFKPLKIGNIEVQHRIGMAPLTRLRATAAHVPTPLMVEYYSQRASAPGTLIISEGTFVSPSACGGFANAPGIWNQAQVDGWKAITDEVHRKGCFIYCQIFAMGRAADAEVAKRDGVSFVGPSAIPIEEGGAIPRTMSIAEIKQMIRDFASAAENAVKAGFDGVECHGGNGYLADQFIQENSNRRDDEWGGSVENRSRFIDEVMKGVVAAVGAERVGLRLTPWSLFQGMRMEDPIPQFSDIIDKARQLNLAYLHLVESRVSGAVDREEGSERLDFAYKLWNGPLLVAGGYKLADARKLVDEEYPDRDIMVVFGRYFISNPDLVYRLKEGLDFSAYERTTFYSGSAVGYVDYPLGAENLASREV